MDISFVITVFNKEKYLPLMIRSIVRQIENLNCEFISECTKEGLRARAAKGIKLGKPKGVLQKSMYDKDKEQIFHLHALGVPIGKIISTHIKYGKYWSLKNYIEKRYKPNEMQAI